jgi:hypothetical protein
MNRTPCFKVGGCHFDGRGRFALNTKAQLPGQPPRRRPALINSLKHSGYFLSSAKSGRRQILHR